MTALDLLLDLQRVDTELDRLRHRRENLPEQQQAYATRDALLNWERRRTEIRGELDDLARKIRAEEAASADLDAERARLERQLKTVVAPREAEALMKEIEGINSRRSELDDGELEHLESTEQLENELGQLDGDEETLRQAALEADEVLALRTSDLDSEVASANDERARLRASISPDMLKRYDALRDSMGGVAVARLNGRQCEGCHMELSAMEADQVKTIPAGEVAECPQCGRMLVLS